MMEYPSRTLTLSPPPSSHLLATTRRRRSSSDSANSPEFEFSNTGCNSQTTLHSADELFSDGFLLPLHLLHLHRSEHYPEPDTGPFEDEPGLDEPGSLEPDPEPSALITSSGSSNSILSASKRWREIFKRADKKPVNNIEEKPESVGKLGKRREKERKNNSNGNNSAELNINIWPFSRSRSAGNNSARSRPVVQSNRKVSSAPCSRSNSSGESKSRKSWPSSPGRAGVHLGRTSPVWHVKKSGPSRTQGSSGSGTKTRVLKLNVPVCMGYRQSLSCRIDESGGDCGGSGGRNGGGDGSGNGNGNGSNGNLFSLRGLFSKKSTSTVLTV